MNGHRNEAFRKVVEIATMTCGVGLHQTSRRLPYSMNTATPKQSFGVPVEEQVACLIPLSNDTFERIGDHITSSHPTVSHGKSAVGRLRVKLGTFGVDKTYIVCFDGDLAADIPGSLYLPEGYNDKTSSSKLEDAIQEILSRFDKDTDAGHTRIMSEKPQSIYRRLSCHLIWHVTTVPILTSLTKAVNLLMQSDKKGCIEISGIKSLNGGRPVVLRSELEKIAGKSADCFTYKSSSTYHKPSSNYFDPSDPPCSLNSFFDNKDHESKIVLFYDPSRPKRIKSAKKAAKTRKKKTGNIRKDEMTALGEIMINLIRNEIHIDFQFNWYCHGMKKHTMISVLDIYDGIKRAKLLTSLRKFHRLDRYDKHQKNLKPSQRPWFLLIKSMSERIDAFEKNEDKKVSLYADITLKQRKRFGTMIREEARALRIRIPNSGETE